MSSEGSSAGRGFGQILKGKDDCGKGNGSIPENVKSKDLHPCPAFFLSAVFMADWRACSPSRQECRGEPVVF